MTDPAQTLVIEESPAPRKRRRWIGVVIAVGAVVILLVVGFFVADGFARQYAVGYVRERIVEALHLDPASDIDVDLGGGSLLLQAAFGSIDDVTVDVARMSFGDIEGTARLVATGVPLDTAKPVDTLGIVVTVDEENVRKLAGFFSGAELTSIDLKGGLIRIGTEFTALFFTVPVAIDLQPTASEGGINFEPVTIMLGDDEISVADLRANPQFRAIAGALLDSRAFCVASYLPRALAVDDVDVVGDTLVLSVEGDGTALSDPALTTPGVCRD